MAKWKFELNSKGVVELLKSSEMQANLAKRGGSVASTAGNGYEAEAVMSGDRAKVFVSAKTAGARRDNLKNNTLLKSLSSGGDS